MRYKERLRENQGKVIKPLSGYSINPNSPE